MGSSTYIDLNNAEQQTVFFILIMPTLLSPMN